MKVIYLHQYFNTPNMSGSTRSYVFAKKLVEQGCEVHVITSRRDNSVEKKYIDGLNVYWLNIPYSNHMSFFRRLISFLHFSLLSTWYACKIKSDLVFATSTPLTIAIPAIIASKVRRIPMVFEVRDLWPEVPIAMKYLKHPILIWLARKLESFAYKNSHTVIALSPGMAQGVKSVASSKVRVVEIPNISDIGFFNNVSSPLSNIFVKYPYLKDKKIILYPGTIGHVNGVDYLARLAKVVRKTTDEIVFLVVGDGNRKRDIIEVASSEGVLDKNFFIIKPVSKKEIVKIFNFSSAVVSTIINLKELESNSANKFFDALAAGKPIFINHGGWQADLIQQNSIGLVLSRDLNVASESIVSFLFNEKTQKEASLTAKYIAEKYFSEDVLSEKFVSELKQAVEVKNA